MKVPLLPTEFVLNGDNYSWWLTKIKPRKDNPFEMIESDSLGYYPHLSDALKCLPKKTLARDDIKDLKQLIAAVESMEKTVVSVGEQIIERYGELNEK